jgi:hypothetical protein
MAESRNRLLWIAGAVTLVGVIFAARVEDEPEPAARGGRRAAAAGVERAPRVAVSPRGVAGDAPVVAIGNMTRPSFDAAVAERIALAWEPAPPPPPSPAALSAQKAAAARAANPPQPQAPPLPFKVIGRFEDGDSYAAIAQSGQVTHVMRRGDVIERNYRVEEVNQKAVTLMYLPLQIKQTLSLEAAK